MNVTRMTISEFTILAVLAARCVSAAETESAPALASSAPHIEAVTISEERYNGNLVVFQNVVFRAPNGDAKLIHWDLVNASNPAPSINIRDAVITVPSEQQKQGAIHTGRWICGFGKNAYTVTLRVTILTTDGIRSNPFDYTIKCS